MPKRSSYKQGTPNWVDLQTSDVDGAKAFYTKLFGWTYDDMPIPEGGAYSMALVGTDTVAAIAGQQPEAAAQGVPPMWNTYVAVDSADDAAARVTEAGGTLLMPVMDVMSAGRMAFALDPTGATFGLWQAGDHIGATLVNEPNSLIWNEIVSDDLPAALAFYSAVLGVEAVETPMGDMAYTLLKVDGDDVGGAMAPPMDGVPNHWHVWFAVADANATAEATTAGGGAVLNGPMDMPIGRMVTIRDPQGAVFGVMQRAAAG